MFVLFQTCRVCGDCGSRTPGNGLSSRWHSNFTVCDSCYQLRNKGFACPICHKAYRAIAQKNMAMCTKCQRYVILLLFIYSNLSLPVTTDKLLYRIELPFRFVLNYDMSACVCIYIHSKFGESYQSWEKSVC